MYMADQERLTRYMTHVIDSFPSERENIEQRTRDVQEKWEMLENKARESLEDAMGMQLFTSWFKILQQGVDTTKSALNSNEHVRDVSNS